MTDIDVVVVRTGTANIASVVAGLTRVGARVEVTTDERRVEAAQRLVLPGVGSFGATMQRLGGLGPIVGERVRSGRPTLAICLGLQLLCSSSEESPGVAGLGIVDAAVTRFPESVRVPQLGWNLVKPDSACRLLTQGHAYFANSYRLQATPAGWAAAMAEHAGPFVAAIERGPVLACQFHPELSGQWGIELLGRWLRAAADGGSSC